jgi:uncharacterized protein HemX
MTTRKNQHKPFYLPVIVLALAAALALGGCARGIHTGSAPNSSQTTSGPSAGATTTPAATGQDNTQQELQNLQGINQQNQDDLNTLGNDDKNTNQDQGNDQETQP